MNCKIGDSAWIIHSECGNIGKIVEVKEYLGEAPEIDGELWHKGYGPCWMVQASTLPLMIKTQWNLEPRSKAALPDAWLKPIPTGELQEDDSDQLEILD